MKIKVRIHTNKWEELRERNAKAKGAQVRVGVFGSETHEGTDLTLVELAAIHEFGSPAANILPMSPAPRKSAGTPTGPTTCRRLSMWTGTATP